MRSQRHLFPRSVRGRLWAALAMLSVSVLVVSVLTWAALQRVDQRLQDLHRQSLTRVAEAISLSKQTSDLVASAPFLLAERSSYLVEQEGAKLLGVLKTVRAEWPQADAPQDMPLRSVADITFSMEASIRDLVAAAGALDALQDDLRHQVARLGRLEDMTSAALQAGFGTEASQLVWWSLKNISGDMLNAAYSGNLIGVGEEQRSFQRQRRLIDPALLDSKQQDFLAQLDKIASGQSNLFELRRRELTLQLGAQNALFRIRQEANAINAAASAYAARAEAVLTKERKNSSTMIQITKVSVAAISVASLALALAAAIFVSRYVASNIAQVSDAMVRLAKGDPSPALPRHRGGQDEIGDLYRSYRYFRANALRLDRSNRRLDQRNALFEKVFANISDGVVLTDATGMITARNPAFARIFRTAGPVLPKGSFVEWLRKGRFGASVIEAGLAAAHRGLAEIRSDDGQILELRASALPDEGRVWLIADVTERRKLAERVEQIDRIETLGKVAGNTAHDFSNVLASIRTHVHLLGQGKTEPLTSTILAIENAVELGISLTERLLAFSRKQKLVPERVDLNQLVAGLVELAEIGLKPDVQLQVTYSPSPVFVLVDPGQLESALLNLILNANKAIEDSGLIKIDISQTQDRNVKIVVSDNGCGMTPEVQQRAIEPFFTTRAQEGGTGLGLSIVYGFIRQSGGDIEIDSKEGLYTSISLTLPVHCDVAAQQVASMMGRALVVDNDAQDMQTAIELCTKIGFSCVGHLSASAAAHAIAAAPFDLVLCDFDLGVGDNGIALLELAQQKNPSTPLILVSGRSNLDQKSAQGFAFIEKPLTLEKITRAFGKSWPVPSTMTKDSLVKEP